MRVIERSEFRDQEGVISLENRFRGTLRHGLAWYGGMEVQVAVTERLSSVLGNDHNLIRNLAIPGTDLVVPLILLGPQGVRVVLPTPLRGVYRAKGDEWLTFDGGARRFKRVRPNQQVIALNLADAVLKYLRSQGFGLPEVEAVLIFTNPRTHVDTARPRVRIVMADGVEHLAANLQQLHPIMDQEDIDALVNALLHPKSPQGEGAEEPAGDGEPGLAVQPASFPVMPSSRTPGEVREIFTGPPGQEAEALLSETDEALADAPFQASDILPTIEHGVRQAIPRVKEGVQQLEQGVYTLDGKVQQLAKRSTRLTRRLPRFSASQWILLGVMVFFELVILAAMVLFVLSDLLYS